MAVSVTIENTGEPGRPKTSKTLHKDEVTIGRAPNNDIVLPESNISGKHALVITKMTPAGQPTLFVKDVGSSNGTFLEDKKLAPNVEAPVSPTDRLIIGKFILTLAPFDSEGTMEVKVPKIKSVAGGNASSAAKETAPEKVSPTGKSKALNGAYEEELRIKHLIHEQVLRRLDLKRKDILALSEHGLRDKARASIEEILVEFR